MKRQPIKKATAWLVLAGTFGAVVFANWLRAPDAHEIDETALAPATSGESATLAPLAPWGKGLPRTGQWRHGLVVVDFDGDGELDIVHGPARKSPDRTPQIFAGDGEGNFKALKRYSFPKLPYDYGDVAVADFDRDGSLDLALASHLVGIAVLVRRGDEFVAYGTEAGLLGGSGERTALTGFSSRAIEALDWNGDGRMDLIASSDGPRQFEALNGAAGRSRRGIVVLLGKDGGFELMLPVNDVAGFGDSLVVAELDPAPGLEILAAANVVGSRAVLYKQTDAGLSLVDLPNIPSQRVVRTVALAPGYALLGGLAMGSEGLEGTLEAVPIGAARGGVQRLLHGEPLRAVSGIGTGDIDADGAVDVLVGEDNGRLRRFEANGSGFTAREVIEPAKQAAGCSVFAIELANLDRTPGDEVVVSYAGDDESCVSGGRIEVYRLSRL